MLRVVSLCIMPLVSKLCIVTVMNLPVKITGDHRREGRGLSHSRSDRVTRSRDRGRSKGTVTEQRRDAVSKNGKQCTIAQGSEEHLINVNGCIFS